MESGEDGSERGGGELYGEICRQSVDGIFQDLLGGMEHGARSMEHEARDRRDWGVLV